MGMEEALDRCNADSGIGAQHSTLADTIDVSAVDVYPPGNHATCIMDSLAIAFDMRDSPFFHGCSLLQRVPKVWYGTTIVRP